MSANSGSHDNRPAAGGRPSNHAFPRTAFGLKIIDSSERFARNASRVPFSTDMRAKARSASTSDDHSVRRSPASNKKLRRKAAFISRGLRPAPGTRGSAPEIAHRYLAL